MITTQCFQDLTRKTTKQINQKSVLANGIHWFVSVFFYAFILEYSLKYVNKKRSAGKVDMVVALINALCLLIEEQQGNSDFGAQW